MIGYLRLEVARTLRDVRYVLLAVGAPAGFYLLFAGIFAGRRAGRGLPAAVEIMVAMATFGAIWAALSATAPRLARDRESGWLRALALTPLAPGRVLAARVLAALAVALPALVGVAITAVLAHGVRLAVWQWTAGLGLLWLGTLPFVVLGVAIGSMTSSTTAYALSTGLYFALAALGGLWVPPDVMSPGLRHIARTLPSYNLADLGWHIAAAHAPPWRDGLILAGWTAGLGLLALAAGAQRPRRRRPPAPAAPQAAAAVSLQRLVKRFGPVQALDGLDMQIPAGTTFALLGPNGAGKTTAIHVALGVLDPDQGCAHLLGSTPRQAIAAGQVGAMLQDSALMAGVRAGELLRFVHRLYPSPADLPALIHATGIDALLHRSTDRLSAGQAQRVRFALAAAGDPRLMVLDEPTSAMDVETRQAFWTAVRRSAAAGRTTLFSTHYLEEADEHADRIAVIQAGRLVADGTPRQVKAIAGAGQVVRFRLTGDPGDPGDPGEPGDRFDHLPGVTAVHRDADARVTLHTIDADATVWALYDHRKVIADLRISDGGLHDAFLALTAASPERSARRSSPGWPGRRRPGC